MPRFIFQLDGLLRHRKHEERERQRDLALAQREYARLEAGLRALTEAAGEATADLRQNHLSGQLDLHFLAAHRHYTLSVQSKSAALEQEIEVARRQVEAAQQRLVEVSRQRKMLENLRQVQQDRWSVGEARREATEAEDVFLRLALADRADDPHHRNANTM